MVAAKTLKTFYFFRGGLSETFPSAGFPVT